MRERERERMRGERETTGYGPFDFVQHDTAEGLQ